MADRTELISWLETDATLIEVNGGSSTMRTIATHIREAIAALSADGAGVSTKELWPIRRKHCGCCANKIKRGNVSPKGQYCLTCAMGEMSAGDMAGELKSAIAKAEKYFALYSALSQPAQSDEAYATFTIKIFDQRTSVHTNATAGREPSVLLDKAIGALEAEKAALKNCPAHEARK